ncbi:MAG TPA: hypothetical protein VNT76_23005 [Candidatus Binatus sp.]|nr:hypothetical protein [Candidatus Binatus sp.]
MKRATPTPAFSAGRRWVGVLLFCSVFFLPFHFHITAATPQVTKECCCLYGSRTQAGPLEAPPLNIPAFWGESLQAAPQSGFTSCITINHLSRAPPVS